MDEWDDRVMAMAEKFPHVKFRGIDLGAFSCSTVLRPLSLSSCFFFPYFLFPYSTSVFASVRPSLSYCLSLPVNNFASVAPLPRGSALRRALEARFFSLYFRHRLVMHSFDSFICACNIFTSHISPNAHSLLVSSLFVERHFVSSRLLSE